MFSFIRWLLIVTFTLVLVLFAVINRDVVSISLYPLPYEIAAPLYLFALAFFLVGYMGCILIGGTRKLSKARELRKYRNTIEALENELAGLRKTSTLPQE